ncbi:MAG: Gfo/Idh/MocA family oxidoreductase [Isosphaeraceae bacterium]
MTTETETASRRDFLRASSLLGAALATGAAGSGAHAAGNGTIRVGLIGCGGRGTGAAVNALAAGKDIKLVALADMFRENLDACRDQLRKDGGEGFDVSDDRCFVGFDAYKKVIECVDVVLLATPPGFRPLHFKAAVDAGKHCFVEKPCAVDAPGVRSVLATCEDARKKNLSVVSGLCWRYHNAMRETIKRIQGGAIGTIQALHCTYNTQNAKTPFAYDPAKWSEMEWQLRNWYYFTWLCGDHNVEQHVHSLDKMAWALKDEYPVRAWGTGGRQVRTGPECGNIFDHHVVTYEFASGARCISMCRQQENTLNDVSDYIYGTGGNATLLGQNKRKSWVIKGEKPWSFGRTRENNMYQQEHDDLFASIRSSNPINDGDWMTKSTLMGIMGRMATYTGQEVTWEGALNSKEDLTPRTYAFGPNPVPPPAIPGVTKLV